MNVQDKLVVLAAGIAASDLETYSCVEVAARAQELLEAVEALVDYQAEEEAEKDAEEEKAAASDLTRELIAVVQEGEFVFRKNSPPAAEMDWLEKARKVLAKAIGKDQP